MRTSHKLSTIGLAVMVLLAATAFAAPDAAAPDKPAAEAKPGGEKPLSEAEVDAILDTMSPEQIEELIKKAASERLKVERSQVIAEIRQGLLYEPADQKAAIQVIEDKPANTRQDNINRICQAFARADVRFRKVYDLYKAGRYKQAAESGKKLLNVQQATYLSAAQHYVYAQVLAADGKGEDAVEVYRDILQYMPDRISLASASALNAAETYEKMNRFMYAMQMYAYCIKNYGLTIDKVTAEKILAKVENYKATYKDPLGALASKMGSVESRLGQTDSGKDTQKTQKEIVAILDDLIKTAEEQQQSSSSQQQQQQQRQKRKGEKEGQGQAQGQAQSQGQQGGMNPTKPMQDSRLVPGGVARPSALSKTHTSGEDGDWAKLSPREREIVKAKMRKLLSERYRDIIRDYNTRLAEEGMR